MEYKVILILFCTYVFNLNTVFSQKQYNSDEADSLHGFILRPEIIGADRPADMFQRNCADCHTEAIMYYTRYSQLWDTTFKSRDKYIHTWIVPVKSGTSSEMKLVAKGINVFNDTTAVRNAMVAVSILENAEWVPVNSQILLTNDSGEATLRINEELRAGGQGRFELLVQLVDEVVYPNGKRRLRINWDMKVHDWEGIELKPEKDLDRQRTPGPWLQFTIAFLMISCLIIFFYFIYRKYLS